jgi:hypothetical protein
MDQGESLSAMQADLLHVPAHAMARHAAHLSKQLADGQILS